MSEASRTGEAKKAGYEEQRRKHGSRGTEALSQPGKLLGSVQGPGMVINRLPPGQVLQLQRSIGNHAVAQMVSNATMVVQRHEAAEVVNQREIVAEAVDLEPEQLVALLAKASDNIWNLPDIWQAAPVNELVEQFALDQATRQEDTSPEFLESAKERARQLFDEGSRGFATLDGRIWMLEGAYSDSDLIHEFIHLLSGPGGQTAIMDISSALNEGFTQYFAVEICERSGRDVTSAYEEEVPFVKALAATYGLPALYDAYFKGQVDALLDKFVAKHGEYLADGKLSDGTNAPKWERGRDAQTRKEEIKSNLPKFKDTHALWLRRRILNPSTWERA